MRARDERLAPAPGVLTRDEAEDAAIEERAAGLLGNPRRLVTLGLAFVAVVVAIYVVLPNVVGLDDTFDRLGDATWYWIAVALGFNIAAFAAYVAIFRGILSGADDPVMERRLGFTASYQITMAGLAATRVFSAAGAGGLVLTYWALRKAGMERRRAACRMVALLVLLYTVYLLALVIFGVLLRTGVLPGDDPVSGTIVPAGIAGVVLLVLALVALIPQDFERRLAEYARGYRRARFAKRMATGPATLASGVRTAIGYMRHPSRGALAVAGAVGFWAANIGVLWASFEAFGGDVSFGVLVQGFFVGMAANLIPSPAGGVGSVDAGMIGAFVLFGVPAASVVFPAVLTYRVIAFWLPIPPGVVAFFQLQRTVARWKEEEGDAGYTSKSKVTAAEAT
ncbi:MAG: lysylphosphatidylglycerol synthase transmembrane domain-containing protein [Thermoleophilaceae bacterium]